MLTELYRLGERPTRVEVAEYLNSSRGKEASHHRKTVLDLWSKRLAHPHRQWRTKDPPGYPWRYPFYFAHEYVQGHGIESVAERLARQVAIAATAHADALAHGPGTDEAEATEDELRAATHALIVWGHVLDRADDEWFPGGLLLRRSPSDRRNRATRRGRRLYEEWLARIRAEYEEGWR